jgi:hypothetical protein
MRLVYRKLAFSRCVAGVCMIWAPGLGKAERKQCVVLRSHVHVVDGLRRC